MILQHFLEQLAWLTAMHIGQSLHNTLYFTLIQHCTMIVCSTRVCDEGAGVAREGVHQHRQPAQPARRKEATHHCLFQPEGQGQF